MLAKEILKDYVMRDGEHKVANGWQTIYEFPNGVRVSVVSGSMFYTDDSHPYELYITNSNDPDNDAEGHLDEFELLARLMQIKEMEVADGV